MFLSLKGAICERIYLKLWVFEKSRIRGDFRMIFKELHGNSRNQERLEKQGDWWEHHFLKIKVKNACSFHPTVRISKQNPSIPYRVGRCSIYSKSDYFIHAEFKGRERAGNESATRVLQGSWRKSTSWWHICLNSERKD